MLHSEWIQSHKKVIRILLLISLALVLCLVISDLGRNRHLIREDDAVVAILREDPEQAVTFPLNVTMEKEGITQTYTVEISLKAIPQEDDGNESSYKAEKEEKHSTETVINTLISEIESKQGIRIALPQKLEDGTVLRWKTKKDFRVLLVLLLLPVCLLYIYETERQKVKKQRQRNEDEIRKALPSFVDQLLLLLHCGMIFQDAFYRITAGYASREEQDAFSRLLVRIGKEADETGAMVITVMKNLSQEVSVREYVRMVNIIMDHQHRGVNLEEKLQAESQLLWEGRKAASLQKGKAMETKMTFPLALLLIALIIIAGMPALMNM